MYYQDNFSKYFQNEVELHEYLDEVEERSWWKRTSSKNLEVVTVSGNEAKISPIEGVETANLVYDTQKNSQLVLRAFGESYLLGSTAIPTLQRRARISGHALTDLDKATLAYILNECFKVAKGRALVHFFEGKVRAIHSGDPKDYSIIKMDEVYIAASAYINTDFKEVAFGGAFTDHRLTSASWTVKDEKMLSAYRDLLKHYGREANENLRAEIRITTSDVAASGVNVYYNMKEGDYTIVLGKALRTIHRGSGGIEDVESNIMRIFEFYKETMRGISRLFGIHIRYPVNTMANVMKEVKIKKKLIAETVEHFKSESGNQPCTAYDVYCGICQALFFAESDGADKRSLLDLEEDISKCASMKWHEHDIPGEVRY